MYYVKNIWIIWQIGCKLPHQRQEIMLVVLPPFVNYSLVNSILEPLTFGFKVVLIPDYKPEKFADYIRKYRPNHINSIPAYWEEVLNIKKMKYMDLSCLKYISYGGEGMNGKKEEEISNFLVARGANFKLTKGLGSTEMVSAATFSYPECNFLNSVGIPLVKTNCKIVEPGTEKEISYNQEGEICFGGPALMVGYYNKEEQTNEIIKKHLDDQNWLHTGDLGYLTEDGVLFLSGRIKRIIMVKGNDGVVTKMFPERIEKVILQHPAVSLCCVVGVEDKKSIHYAKAAIVLKDDYEPNETLTHEILGLCKDKLPNYMIPEKVVFMTELPRTQRGKIDYRALENKE